MTKNKGPAVWREKRGLGKEGERTGTRQNCNRRIHDVGRLEFEKKQIKGDGQDGRGIRKREEKTEPF